LALIAAISEDGGLVDFALHPKAINTESFVAFINQLSSKLGGGDFAIFLDNLSVHKTKEAKLIFEQLNITEIYNIPYSPQFNGIECYFAQVKAYYKKVAASVCCQRYTCRHSRPGVVISTECE
jgi:transposase